MSNPENHINNYYLLHRLVDRLNETIVGQRLEQCYSINKIEIIFAFSGFCIKAIFGEQCFIFSHEDIYKANSTKLKSCFEEIISKAVIACKVHNQDRSFRIIFDGGYNLVFMMYGRNGNVLLFKINDAVDQFRTQFEKHKNIKLADFNSFQEPVFEAFQAISNEKGALAAIKQLFTGFSKDMIKYLVNQDIELFEIPAQWKRLQDFERLLLKGTIDVLENIDNGIKSIYLSLLPSGDDKVIVSTNDVIEALDTFARAYYFINYFRTLKDARLSQLKTKIEKCKSQLSAANHHLEHLENDSNYKKQADIIMANLHQIPAGAEEVTLFDFYTDKDIVLTLKRGLSPQNWAEKLYRKAKNQVIEKQKTIEKINGLETEWLNLNEELGKIEAIEDIKELKILNKTEKVAPAKELSPFRHFSFEGYDIFVGKNSANNDKLTFGFAHKEDMWLHAQGVSGSHVIIRHKQKAIFPMPVIEKAAQIAAFNSKSKGTIMVPVIYTIRKFVRKPKGAAPGSVICEKESMIMVEPGV